MGNERTPHLGNGSPSSSATASIADRMTHSDGSVPMRDGSRVRFWQPAPEAGAELVCAYLESSESPLHLHEEWQFGVLDAPARLSIGAFRREVVEPTDVTLVPPYAV